MAYIGEIAFDLQSHVQVPLVFEATTVFAEKQSELGEQMPQSVSIKRIAGTKELGRTVLS